MGGRIRTIGSYKSELLKKSREAMLCAIQNYNNPNIHFKSEVFIVLAIIAWTYLLHAYYRFNKIDYKYFDVKNGKKKYDKTKFGAYKNWSLETCLNNKDSPVDKDTKNNLLFLIEIRHEIEHQMTTKLDSIISAKFQACCLNYNDYLKKLFSDKLSLDRSLSYSLQFALLKEEQYSNIKQNKEIPLNILRLLDSFDQKLSEDEYLNPRFAYRVIFLPILANRKGQADQVIEFIDPKSDLAQSFNTKYAVIKSEEKPKYRVSQIVDKMRSEGFTSFNTHKHTIIWKELDGKNPSNGYGAYVVGTWYWYTNWFDVVRSYLCEHKELF